MAAMQMRCPICKETNVWEENPCWPFCSERCKLIDLGKWASETYRIPEKDPGAEPGGENNGTSRNGQEI